MISAQRHPHEFQRTAGDDGDDGGADPVEQPLHPWQTAEADVQLGQDEHHEKRGRHERDPDQRRAEHMATHPAEVDRELCRERAGGELRKGEALLVLLRVDPAALLHQVLLHVSGERNRPAEPQRAEPQEVEEKRPQARTLDGAGRHRRDVFLALRAAPVSAALAASAAYSASNSAAPCASRALSSACCCAMPAISRSTPDASGRPNFASLQSMSCTISAMTRSARSPSPKPATSVSNVPGSPPGVDP